MTDRLAIAVAGAGLIGKRHIAALSAAGGSLHSIVDPNPEAASYARQFGVPHFTELDDALASPPDGVILATPNQIHESGAIACVRAKVPVLIEKPIAVNIKSAQAIVRSGKEENVPILVGHHRRHLPVVRRAREIVASGDIGALVSVHSHFWIAKPDAYFSAKWRNQSGAGPLLVNLIHDIDLLRYLVGEIDWVCAASSNRIRHHAVEDTCAAVVSFEHGALGTIQGSDTIVSPWSWEMTSHDNAAYPPTAENSLLIGGTKGSIALPRGEVWSDGARRDWFQPISQTIFPRENSDPLVAQLQNFLAVIRGEEEPVCSAEQGMSSLKAVLAIQESAACGAPVRPTA